MPIYSKESLETLRQRVNLVEVLNSHIELKPSGASYKALCPFHDEKSPSFTVQKGDMHYHCFGCGAHGDSIHFLMNHLKMNFLEAVENLAQRFHVPLEQVEGEEKKGPNKAPLKQALEFANRFYHFYLLYTHEGHQALKYLYSRGLDLNFIRQFQIGLAPKQAGMFRKIMHSKGISETILVDAGLLSINKSGGYWEFFNDRITFPIHDVSGAIIGFSCRKYNEDTFGGKYINTPETALFKKSKVLFGFNYSRRRIAKERMAIVVEGQIDALRLIQAGFNITVAGQGTAFGEGHVKELTALGLNQVYLALDADKAGQEATNKIGNLFQKEGVEVRVITMPTGSDPDSFLTKKGPEEFLKLLDKSIDYLTFVVNHLSKTINIDSPAGKTEIIQTLVKQIRQWDHPLMVHESLRKIAHLMRVPETMIGVGQEHTPNIYIKKTGTLNLTTVDPDRIIESDFLRWLLVMAGNESHLTGIAKINIFPKDMRIVVCRNIYQTILERDDFGKPLDLLSLAIDIDDAEGQTVISELLQKKINKERVNEQFNETIQKILDRNWMELREEIKMKIQSGNCGDDEVLELVKQFDELKRNPPQVKLPIMEGSLV